MPGVLFTNAFMLAGMAALAIPVLIHLLLKRKKKRLRFSTIRFFLKQDEQSSRRRKLRHLLLLSLRLLLVALLVAAFARPYLRHQAGAGTARQKQRVIFVLDSSASMLATGTDGQRWTLAKGRMQKVLSALNQDDTAALIVCSAHAELASPFSPPATVTHMLSGLDPTYGVSNLGEGLRQALKLLPAGDNSAHNTLYVVSDFQRSACQKIAGIPIPQNVEMKLLNIGDLHSPNLAITSFESEAGNGRKPQVTVASFSDEGGGDVNLKVTVDGQESFSTPVQLRPGESTNIEVTLPRLRPGWHDAVASLRAKDCLEADNSRYSCLFVPEPVRIFLVETRPAKHVFDQECFFVAAALDPTKDSTNSAPGPFNTVQMSPEELTRKLTASAKQIPCEVIVLPGLRQIPAGMTSALTSFVQAGGGLLLFLNDDVSANQYNGAFSGFLPAQLSKTESAPDSGSAWRIGEHDTNSVVFGAFRLPHSGDFNIPEFTKRYVLNPASGASLLANFDDDAPLLCSRIVDKGRAVLVNTSSDTAWSDWPKHKTFVPWLHGLANFLAKNSQYQRQQTNEVLAGEDLDLETGSEAGPSTFTLEGPGGSETSVSCDNQGRLRDPLMKRPGIYSLRDNKGRQIKRLALNVPAQECDLETLSPAEFQNRLTRVTEPPKETLAANLFGSGGHEKEIWTTLLAAALLLLLAEPLIANRTSA